MPYLRIKKNSATSYDFSVSPDGCAWVRLLGAHDPSAFLTIDQIGFGILPGTVVTESVACHWLRLR